MLDFGTRMSEAVSDREDDLFAELSDRGRAADVSADPGRPEEAVSAVADEISRDGELEALSVTDEISRDGELEALSAADGSSETDDSGEESPEAGGGSPLRHFLSFRRKRGEDPLAAVDRQETADILKEARLHANLTLEDVERETQIRKRYLNALEHGDLSSLPQQVYVLAYLRKLCALYHISSEEEEELVRPWRALRREVPENLPGAMIADDEPETVNRRGWLEICLPAAAAVVVIGIVAFLVILVVSYFNRDSVNMHFDHTALLELQPKPQLAAPGVPPVRPGR